MAPRPLWRAVLPGVALLVTSIAGAPLANAATEHEAEDAAISQGVVESNHAGFTGTGAWTTWQNATIRANAPAGTLTVRATATTANGGPNVDRLTVSPVDGQADNDRVLQVDIVYSGG